MKYILTCVALLALCVSIAGAQNLDGKWVLGVRGGGNLWVNDLNNRLFGPGVDLTLRYGVSRHFSLGLQGGWELLKAKQDPVTSGNPYGYLKADAIPASFLVYYHFLPGSSFAPYAYAGVGGMFYKRRTTDNVYVPANKFYSAINVPVGLGFEQFLANRVSLNVDLGYRLNDDWTDNVKGLSSSNTVDSHASGKLGLNFYFGRSGSDDDDGDGLTNAEEERLGTDPEKFDTDGDGLSDGDEVLKYHTDPLKFDTDGDGLSDGDEVLKYHTDPLKMDTDGDGLSDGDEVLKYHTDPLKVDTDGDGLSDGDEVLKYHTDPLKMDTDGGGVDDGTEVKRGSNPLDPSDDLNWPPKPKLEVGKAIVLEGIVFRSGKSTIDPVSEPTLTDAFNTLKENPEIAIEVRGYTDNVGKLAANKKLSQRRAEAVRSWLVRKGIDSMRIAVKGYGPENPISDNSTPEGRSKNRRIEFFRTK